MSTSANVTSSSSQQNESKSNTASSNGIANNGLFDQFFAMEQLKIIQGIVSSDQKFSKENITMMLMLCGFSNIKEIVAFIKSTVKQIYSWLDKNKLKGAANSFIDFVKSNIKLLAKFIWYIISLKFLKKMYYHYKYSNVEKLEEAPKVDENKIFIKLASTQKIYEALIKYILDNDVEHSVESNYIIDNKDNNLILSEIWNNVKLPYKEIIISIESKLAVEFLIKHHKKQFTQMSAVTGTSRSATKITPKMELFDVIPFEEIKAAFIKSFNENFPSMEEYEAVSNYRILYKKNKLYCNSYIISPTNTGYLLCSMADNIASNMGITMNIKNSYDSGNKEINYQHNVIWNKLYYMLYMIRGLSYDGLLFMNTTSMKELLYRYQSTQNILFGVDISSLLRKAETTFYVPSYSDADANIYTTLRELKDRSKYANWLLKQIIPEIEAKEKQKYISISIKSENININLINEWLEFAHNIQTLNIDENETKIPMEFKYLCIKRETILKEIVNPKYEEYMKQHGAKDESKQESPPDSEEEEEAIDTAKDSSSRKKKTKKHERKHVPKYAHGTGYGSDIEYPVSGYPVSGYYNAYFNKPPAEHITIEEKESKLSIEVINSIYKEPDTLYLAEKEKNKLNSYLYQFKYCKDKLKDLGLPYKLGIMLYGPPGSGKTSTIQSIVTYFQKPAFYINLNGVTKNSELKMMFDYVTKECLNGGIIVMEDIDAMTKVVHRRVAETRELSVSDIMYEKDSELTLEYFLNILQGSLTVDGTIFVATTNHIELLDPAFIRDGRFDVKIELRKADHYQIKAMYLKFIEREIPAEILERVPEYTYTCATIIAQLQQFIMCKDVEDSIIMEPFICENS